ncbi:hypothetical protein VTN49DRAFT_3524 [Thermomyces lanuginosus]|uniref:uncharacterized protein n=1 Tax=Thermomyces lanuginosus TaxID=5541 RepID=UPI00374358BE
MEPGGESTQYESIRTVTKTPPRQKGQLGVHEKSSESEVKVYLPDDNEIARQRQQQMLEEDEKLAQQLGGGRDVAGLETGQSTTGAQRTDEEADRTRRILKYGPGTGIGA